jgi:hypothetical protein
MITFSYYGFRIISEIFSILAVYMEEIYKV